jgi:hypothetical protein
MRDQPPQSVSATRSGISTLITDALIGSVQSGESFNFFVQTTEGGAFTQLKSRRSRMPAASRGWRERTCAGGMGRRGLASRCKPLREMSC